MKILKSRNKDLEILICDCHYPLVKDQIWTAMPSNRRGSEEKWKFKGTVNGKEQLMHRYIMGFPDGVVDHKDGNSQNNQCSNLRVTNQTRNNFNQHGPKHNSKSGYKGVYWHKAAQKWAAEVVYNHKKHYLGLFEDVKDAARAYNAKALELDPDFAYLNVINWVHGREETKGRRHARPHKEGRDVYSSQTS